MTLSLRCTPVRIVGVELLDSTLEFAEFLLAAARLAEVDVVVGAEVGVDHLAGWRRSRSAVPSAMIAPSAITTHPVADVVHHVHVVLDEEHRAPLVLAAP